MNSLMYRPLGPLPTDAIPQRHPNDVDPRGDGRQSQGKLLLALPEGEGASRVLGIVLDSEGLLYSASDISKMQGTAPGGGTGVVHEQVMAVFERDGSGQGYFASATYSDGDREDEGAPVTNRRLTDSEIDAIRSIANQIVSRDPRGHL